MLAMTYLTFELDNGIGKITLNRPDKYNAFNAEFIAEFTQLLQQIAQNQEAKVVVLQGAGKHFCAGADLEWMQAMVDFSFEENKEDALKLGQFLHALSTLPQPTIAAVHGKVFGGGLGIIACCDIIVAQQDTQFCFSEVKLGLIPATITPYVIRQIGYSQTKRLYLTAEQFDSELAKSIGMVHHLTKDNLNETALHTAKELLSNGTIAMAQAKQLVDGFYPVEHAMQDFTAELLAHVRKSDEAQAMMQQFLGRKS